MSATYGQEDGSLAIDADAATGHAYVAYAFRNGNTVLSQYDVFSSELVWSSVFYTSSQRPGRISVSAEGSIAVITECYGEFWAPPLLRHRPPVGEGSYVAVVVVSSEGDPLWQVFIPEGIRVGATAFTADGELIVTGSFAGTVTLGDDTLVAGTDRDLFVVRFDAAGEIIDARDFGNRGSDEPTYVALDAAGDVYLTGLSGAGIDLGGGSLGSTSTAWLARLGPAFEHRWSRTLPVEAVDGIALSPSGELVVSGVLDRTTTLDPGVTVSWSSGAFVAGFDAATGVATWMTGQRASYADPGAGIAIDDDGTIYHLASIAGSTSGTLPTETTLALFAYTETGERRWYRAWSAGIDVTAGTGIAVGGNRVAIAGHADDAIDLGMGEMSRIDAGDVFIGVFEP